MVNNSTNINQTKESLNSDGQQFYQYQQIEQSMLTLTHWTEKDHMMMEIQVPAR